MFKTILKHQMTTIPLIKEFFVSSHSWIHVFSWVIASDIRSSFLQSRNRFMLNTRMQYPVYWYWRGPVLVYGHNVTCIPTFACQCIENVCMAHAVGIATTTAVDILVHWLQNQLFPLITLNQVKISRAQYHNLHHSPTKALFCQASCGKMRDKGGRIGCEIGSLNRHQTIAVVKLTLSAYPAGPELL